MAQVTQMNRHKDAKLSIYIPPKKGGTDVLDELKALGEREDRSINYLVVEAIREYLSDRL